MEKKVSENRERKSSLKESRKLYENAENHLAGLNPSISDATILFFTGIGKCIGNTVISLSLFSSEICKIKYNPTRKKTKKKNQKTFI